MDFVLVIEQSPGRYEESDTVLHLVAPPAPGELIPIHSGKESVLSTAFEVIRAAAPADGQTRGAIHGRYLDAPMAMATPLAGQRLPQRKR